MNRLVEGYCAELLQELEGTKSEIKVHTILKEYRRLERDYNELADKTFGLIPTEDLGDEEDG